MTDWPAQHQRRRPAESEATRSADHIARSSVAALPPDRDGSLGAKTGGEPCSVNIRRLTLLGCEGSATMTGSNINGSLRLANQHSTNNAFDGRPRIAG